MMNNSNKIINIYTCCNKKIAIKLKMRNNLYVIQNKKFKNYKIHNRLN